MKQNSKKTLTRQTYSLDIHSHTRTLTHSYTHTLLRIQGTSDSHSVCFALRPREHTRIRIHKSLSAYEQGGEGERPPTHTHITVRHSSHKQLSRNHNKFTSAAQMFDKKFCEKLSLISQHLNDFYATLGERESEREWEGGGEKCELF